MLFTPLLELKSSQEPSRYLDLARLQLVHELSCESRIGLRWTSCVKPFYILVVYPRFKSRVQILQRCFTARLRKCFVEMSPVFPAAWRGGGDDLILIFMWTCPLTVLDLQPKVYKNFRTDRDTPFCVRWGIYWKFSDHHSWIIPIMFHTNPQFGNFFSLGNFPTPILQIINEDGTFK